MLEMHLLTRACDSKSVTIQVIFLWHHIFCFFRDKTLREITEITEIIEIVIYYAMGNFSLNFYHFPLCQNPTKLIS